MGIVLIWSLLSRYISQNNYIVTHKYVHCGSNNFSFFEKRCCLAVLKKDGKKYCPMNKNLEDKIKITFDILDHNLTFSTVKINYNKISIIIEMKDKSRTL
jgi:hypothetical protein